MFIELLVLKGVMSRPMVDALSELGSPFLKEGNSVLFAAIASSKLANLVTRITTAQTAQIEIKCDQMGPIWSW